MILPIENWHYFHISVNNLEFSRLVIGLINNLKCKAIIIKGETYLSRMISTEVKKWYLIEKRIKRFFWIVLCYIKLQIVTY